MRHIRLIHIMRTRPAYTCLALCAAALLVAGCGVTASGGSPSIPGNQGNTSNTSPPTIAGGLVTIATDHSIYTPSAAIHVTVVNHMATSIVANDTRASCSIVDLQILQNGTWQSSFVARCPLGRPALPITIAGGASYSATITAGYRGMGNESFPDGQYRLVLSYTASKQGPPVIGGSTTVYSATLTVSGPVTGATPGSGITPTLVADPGASPSH